MWAIVPSGERGKPDWDATKTSLSCFVFYSSHCSLITDWQGSCTKRHKLNNHRNCVYCDEWLTPWPHEAGWIVALHQCKPSSKPPAPEKARHNIPSFTGHKEDDSNLCLFLFEFTADYYCCNSFAAIQINSIMTRWMLQWKGSRLWSDQSKHATVFLFLSPWDQFFGRWKGSGRAFNTATVLVVVVFERACPYLLCVNGELSEWNSTAASVQVMQSEGMQTVGYFEIQLCLISCTPGARRLCVHASNKGKNIIIRIIIIHNSLQECCKITTLDKVIPLLSI